MRKLHVSATCTQPGRVNRAAAVAACPPRRGGKEERKAVDRIGAVPATAVFIGNDWAADILGAIRVGLKAIYVNDQAAESIKITTGESHAIEVAPTLEAIVGALRIFGWQEVAS